MRLFIPQKLKLKKQGTHKEAPFLFFSFLSRKQLHSLQSPHKRRTRALPLPIYCKCGLVLALARYNQNQNQNPLISNQSPPPPYHHPLNSINFISHPTPLSISLNPWLAVAELLSRTSSTQACNVITNHKSQIPDGLY
ncbi:hypothetical protein Dimus_009592 [Dionaea muscipula]